MQSKTLALVCALALVAGAYAATLTVEDAASAGNPFIVDGANDATLAEGKVYTNALRFVLSSPLANALNVKLECNINEATATATIAAGQTDVVASLTITDDQVVEPTRDVRCRAVVDGTSADVTPVSFADAANYPVRINALPDTDTAVLSASDAMVQEGNQATVELELSAAVACNVRVHLNTFDLTAVAGTDYTDDSQTVTITAGTTTAQVNFATVNDDVTERMFESFYADMAGLSVTCNVGGRVTLEGRPHGLPHSVIVIVDDDASTIALEEVALTKATEGNAVQFLISMSKPSDTTVTLHAATSDGTAVAAASDAVVGSGDYTPLSLTVTFRPGDTVHVVHVLTKDDNIVELDETLHLTISNLQADHRAISFTGAVTATGTIVNNDHGIITVNSRAAAEGSVEADAGTVMHTVTFSNPVDAAVAFHLESVDALATSTGTGVGVPDFTAYTNDFTFAAGETSKTFTITFAKDTVVERDEFFYINAVVESLNAQDRWVTFGNAVPVAADFTVAHAIAKCTITDDDAAALSVHGASLLRTATYTNNVATVTITIQTNHMVDAPVTVTLTSTRDTAADADSSDSDSLSTLPSADYQTINKQVTIPAGDLSVSVDIEITKDQVVELNQRFFVNIADVQVDVPAERDVAITTNQADVTIEDPVSATLSIADETAAESSDLTFTVTSTQPLNADVTFDLVAAAGTASADDFAAGTTTITLPRGHTSVTHTIAVVDDLVVEAAETFTVTIGNLEAGGLAVTIADAEATGTITNNDHADVSVVATLAHVNENTANIDFTVTLSRPVDVEVKIDMSTVDGTAVSSGVRADFSAFNGHVTFPALSTQQTLSITVAQDNVVEADETFTVSATGATAYDADSNVVTRDVSADDSVTGTIFNDDVSAISISDADADEGSAATLTVTLTKPVDVDVTFTLQPHAAVGASTASANDYPADVVSVTVPAYAYSVNVDVATTGDDVVELNEDFAVTADNLAPANRAVSFIISSATVTIVNNDHALVTLSRQSASEGDQVALTLTLDYPVDTAITVTLATADGTAVSTTVPAVVGNDDFTAFSEGVSIAAGELSRTVYVSTNEDNIVELDETFTATASAVDASGRDVQLGATVTVTAKIINDDNANINIADPTVEPGQTATLTVTMDHPCDATVTVAFDTVKDTAVDSASSDSSLELAAPDFVAVHTVLTFLPGETSHSVDVQTNADNVVQLNEVFYAKVSDIQADGRSVSILDDQAPVYITNTLSALLTVGDVSVTEGGNAVFTVGLSFAVDADVTVHFATSDNTATASDYTPVDRDVTIPKGRKTVQVTVATGGDNTVELNENFRVVLSNLRAADRSVTIEPATDGYHATGYIANDDSAVFALDDTIVNVQEAAATITLTVSMTHPADVDVSVSYETTDLVAVSTAAGVTGDHDFSAATGVVVIPAGQTSASITVTINDEDVVELDENFKLNLVGALSNAGRSVSLGNDEVMVTIQNDDSAVFDFAARTVTEGDALNYAVTLSHPVDVDVTVTFATADGTAVSTSAGVVGDNDFVAGSSVLTFTAGSLTPTVAAVVASNADDVVELDESFAVTLSAASVSGRAVTIATAATTGTITNNDFGTMSVNDVTVLPGATEQFVITMSLQVDHVVTIHFDTSDGSAVQSASTDASLELAASDYSATHVVVSFAAGETSQTVDVTTNTDNVVQLNEDFTVTLSNLNAAGRAVEVVDATGVGHITNNNAATLFVADVTVTEGAAAVFTVALTKAVDTDVTFTFTTVDGTATAANADYTSVAATYTIVKGRKSIDVSVATGDDNIVELNEAFGVVLSRLIAGDRQVSIEAAVDGLHAQGFIGNDDSAVLALAGNVAVAEGEALTFDLSLSYPVDVAVTVVFSTADGSAVSTSTEVVGDNDFTAVQGLTVTFAALQTAASVTVASHSDVVVELNEVFSVGLTGLANSDRAVTLGLAAATGTINNNDAAIVATSAVSTVEGNNAVFTITLDFPVDTTVTVLVSTADGTAVAGPTANVVGDNDYSATSQQISFLAGVQSQTFTVATTDDAVVELAENFVAAITTVGASGRAVTISTTHGAALATISNNDAGHMSVADATVNPGDVVAVVVSMDLQVDTTVTVQFDTSDVTAVHSASSDSSLELAVSDYANTHVTVSFGPGSTTQTVNIAIGNDNVVQLLESFRVTLSALAAAGRNVVVSDDEAVIAINNNIHATVLSVADVTVTEGAAAVFTVTLTHAVDTDVSFDFATVDGTATVANADYSAVSQRVTIAKGRKSVTVSVATTADNIVELDESFGVVLSHLNAGDREVAIEAAVDGVHATGFVNNDDTADLSLGGNVAVTEGAALHFALTLTNPVDVDVTVVFATADDSAVSTSASVPGDNDFGAVTTTVTFTAGQTAASVAVQSNADNTVELNEAFNVALTNLAASGRSVAVGTGAAVGSIYNDDSAVISTASVSGVEGSALAFNFALSNPVDVEVSVTFATADGSAVAGPSAEVVGDNDYSAVSTTVTFAAGATTATAVEVATVADAVVELDETFSVGLSGVAASRRDVTASADAVSGTITNNDAATISVADASANPGEVAAFAVTLSAQVDATVSVRFDTADGSAVASASSDSNLELAAADYANTHITVTFAAGVVSQTVNIAIAADNVVQLVESFNAALSALSNAGRAVTILDGAAVCTIANNNAAVVSVSDVSVVEGADAVFTVTLSKAVDAAVSVQFDTAVGTASANDFTAVSTTVTIAKGHKSATVTVATGNDNVVELNEAFGVVLSNLNAAGRDVSLAAAVNGLHAQGFIGNNDVASVNFGGNVAATEGSAVTFAVALTNPVDVDVTVAFATGYATATADDFAAKTATITFAAGVTAATVVVDTTADDVVELDETFTATLGELAAAGRSVSIGSGSAVGTIQNDDAAVVSFSSAIDFEGSTLTFTATLNKAVDTAVTVAWNTVDGTATANSDYTAASGSISFTGTVGETKTVSVVTLTDTVYEAVPETFTVTGTASAAGRSVSVSAGTGSIKEARVPVTLTAAASQTARVLTFTATFAGAVSDLTVSDFVIAAGTLGFSNQAIAVSEDGLTAVLSLTVATPLAAGSITVSLPEGVTVPPNLAAAGVTVSYAPPTVTLSSTVTQTAADVLAVTATFSAPVTGVTAGALTVSSGAVYVIGVTLNSVSSTVYIFSVQVARSANVNLVFSVASAAGTIAPANQASNSVTVAYTADLGVLTSSVGTSGSTTYQRTVVFTATFSTGRTDIVASSLAQTLSGVTVSSTTFAAVSSTVYTWTVVFGGPAGTLTVNIPQVTDANGNILRAATSPFSIGYRGGCAADVCDKGLLTAPTCYHLNSGDKSCYEFFPGTNQCSPGTAICPGVDGTTASTSCVCNAGTTGPCRASSGSCSAYLTGTTICAPGTQLCSGSTDSTGCSGCVGGSVGNCRSAANVCFGYVTDGAGNTVCPAGTTACSAIPTVSVASALASQVTETVQVVVMTADFSGLSVTSVDDAAEAVICDVAAFEGGADAMADCVVGVWSSGGAVRRRRLSTDSTTVRFAVEVPSGTEPSDVAAKIAAGASNGGFVAALNAKGVAVSSISNVVGEVITVVPDQTSAGSNTGNQAAGQEAGTTVSAGTGAAAGLSNVVIGALVAGFVAVVAIIAVVVYRNRRGARTTRVQVISAPVAPRRAFSDEE